MRKLYLRLVCLFASLNFLSVAHAQQVVNAGPDITLSCGVSCTNITASLLNMPGISTTSYLVSSIPFSGNYGFTGGTSAGITCDDCFGSSLTLPFTFCFYGTNFNNIVIGSNGLVTFTTTYAGGGSVYGVCGATIPSGSYPTYSIMGDYTDLYPQSSTINYQTVGTAPYRKHIISYNAINYYFSVPSATFQIVLYETTNEVEVYIQQAPNLAGTANGCGIVGIQKNSTTALAAPGRNNTFSTYSSEAWRFTPNGGSSGGAPTNVVLTTLTGTPIQVGTPVTVGTNYSVTFTNVCSTTDTTDYVVEAQYLLCGGTTSFKDTIRVIKTVTPPPTVTSPVTACQNSVVGPLQAVGQNLLWYTVATGGTGSSTTPTPNTSISGLDTFWVSQTINGCESVRVPIYINILPQPVITAGSNSPICAGSTLLLTTTQVSGGTYQWSGPNLFSSTFQNPSIGNAQSINAGTYQIITTLNGCASLPATVTVVITPTPLISTVNFTNATQCNGTGTITLSGLTANTSYTVNFTKNGVAQTPLTITSSGTGQVVITGLGAGVYASITVTINGCISNTVGPVTISQPTPPTINYTSTNPTTCSGTNGSITLTGLVNGQSYTVNYTKNGTPQTPLTLTASGGSVVIPNLTAGTYTNISVTAVVSNCNSNVIASVILSDPAAPNITIAFTNPTVCNTNTGTITISGLVNGQSYTINYSKNGTPQTPITQTASGGNLSLTALGAGNYTGITVTINGCVSNIVAANLVDPSGPVINAVGNNPTQCNTSTGSIVLNGLVNGMSYTIYYTKNGTPQTPITQTATGGAVTIPNLPTGTYTNIYVIINSCSSNTQGPIVLTDPSAPAVPTVNANTPVCVGQPLNLTSSSTTTGVTYNWSGPNTYTSTLQNPTINNVQLTQAGTYSVTASLNGCTSAPASVTVVVNPSPATPAAGVNNPICQGNNINLTAATSTTGVTWTWSGPGAFSSNTQNPTIPNATPAQSGNYIVFASANGCPSISDTVSVIVIATPAIQYTAINPGTCGSSTGSITLNGLINAQSYVINYDKNGVPQTAITQTATSNSVVINNLSAGTYTNITVSLNGCPSNIVGPVTLTDPTQPPTPSANGNTPICEGATLNLTASNITNATYTWTGPNSFNSTSQNPTINPATLAASGTYSVVAVVNGCTSQPGTVNIVVNPVPATPSLSTNAPICEGDVLDINSNTIPGVTYSWTGPNSFSSNNEDNAINNAMPVMSGAYTLVVSNGNCSATANINAIVNPIPLAPIVVSPTEFCQFESTQLTAQGQNLLWYTQATGGNGVASVTPPTSSPTQMTYYVSQTVNGCEGPRAAMIVIVKPQPFAPTAPTSYTYCQYDTTATQLTATGNNLLWYDVATGGSPLAGAPTPNTAIPGVFHYYVSQTDSSCESNRTDITVTIHAKPDLPTVEQITLCQNDASVPVNVQGQNLLWYTSPTGGTGSATVPNISTADTGVTDYYVSQTINGCEGDRALLRVVINPQVVASFSVDKDTVCDSYPLTLTFTGIAPSTATFDWTFGGATEVTGTGAGPYTVIWASQGPKTITLTVSNLNCTGTATKTVIVLPTPDPNFNIQADACIDEKVRVQAAYDQMDMPGYTWGFDGATVLEGSGPGPYILEWKTPGQKVISMSLTNIPCPSLAYYDTINVHHPVAKIASISNDAICTGDSVMFTAQPGLDYKYQWTPASFFSDEQSTGLSAWGKIRQSGNIWLTVYDRWGCTAVDSMLMNTKACCDVFLPNAFTPNGDGKNDVFRMVTKGHQQMKVFMIVDRWGKLVFETANQYEGWDGSFHGEAMDMGTYKYYLKYVCEDSKETIEMKGDVILVR